MTYTPPALPVLLLAIPTIRQTCLHETKERMALLSLLEHFSEVVRCLPEQEETNERYPALLGAWLYCLEMINQEYYLHSPEYKNGYLYNSGSELYSALSKALDHRKDNAITAREKLIYINHFHYFLATHLELLAVEEMSIDALLFKIRDCLAVQLKMMTTDIARIVNAIPTEKSITSHMEALPSQYQEHKTQPSYLLSFFKPQSNKNRVLFTQMTEAIAKFPFEDESHVSADMLPRSQRVKMGLLLYILNVISNEYYIRSPKNSVLFCECAKVLNISIDKMGNTYRLACLAAFHNYLVSIDTRKYLENYGVTHFGKETALNYIDIVLAPICENITFLEAELGCRAIYNWPMTTTLADIGSLICSAPGYGLGSFVGLTVSETQPSLPVKDRVGRTFSGLATAFFGGSSAGYFAFMAGDFIVASTLTRAFAKLFEWVGMVMGGAAGGIVGLSFDLSYKGLQGLCSYCLNLAEKEALLMKNVDIELLRCIKALPLELFAPERQAKLTYALGAEADIPPLKKLSA